MCIVLVLSDSNPIGRNGQSIVIDYGCVTRSKLLSAHGECKMARQKLSSFSRNREKQHSHLIHRELELVYQECSTSKATRNAKFFIPGFDTVTSNENGMTNNVNRLGWY